MKTLGNFFRRKFLVKTIVLALIVMALWAAFSAIFATYPVVHTVSTCSMYPALAPDYTWLFVIVILAIVVAFLVFRQNAGGI